MKKLTLAKETLRVLDDDDLTQVVGGAGSDKNHGHGKTGRHGSCNAHDHGHGHGHGKTGRHGSCNAGGY